MKIYDHDNDDIIQGLVQTIEKDTGEEVFTIRVLDRADENHLLDTIIVLANKAILRANIRVEEVEGKVALRIQGNFI